MDDSLARTQEGMDAPADGARRPGPLAGRVALVTGGAQGLACLCRDLSGARAIVIAGDVREGRTQEPAQSVRTKRFSVEERALDVGDPAAATAFEDTIARQGHCDIPVNKACQDITVSMEKMPINEWQRVIGVNPTGRCLATKAVFPHMRRQGAGHIVNIVSTAAKRAWPNASAYHASKWGFLGLSHALHVEARPLNIKVTAVISGKLRTPFLPDRFPDIDQSTLQDAANVARTVRFGLSQPAETVIPEPMVLPMRETSWP